MFSVFVPPLKYGLALRKVIEQGATSRAMFLDQGDVMDKGISVGTNRDTNWQFAPRQTK